jgi:ribonuclease R
VTLGGGKLQKRLTRSLQHFEGKPEAQIIHILKLRSMSQAKYNPVKVGHFGLGFDFYTHFTSPIRRYPDLIVHRLIKNQIMPGSKYRLMSDEDLATAGTWLSACEQRSAKAERQIQAIKKARFMEKLVGESFDGLISSVTKFGVFVLLREFNIDGLVRLDDLGGEKFEFDEQNLTLTAKRSGFSYKMGDVVRVTVSMVDIEQGQINFVLESSADAPVRKQKDREDDRKERFSKNREERHARSNSGSRAGGKQGFGGKSDKKHEKSFEGRDKGGKKDFGKKPFKGKSSGKGSKPESKYSESKNSRFGSDRSENKSFRKPESRLSGPKQNDFYSPPQPAEKSTGAYVPKPKYGSLSEYLDQRKQKGSHETESEPKRPFRSAENRKNSEERGETKNNRHGAGKARPQKFGRKNKSR